jgi:hypothetical protein
MNSSFSSPGDIRRFYPETGLPNLLPKDACWSNSPNYPVVRVLYVQPP